MVTLIFHEMKLKRHKGYNDIYNRRQAINIRDNVVMKFS